MLRHLEISYYDPAELPGIAERILEFTKPQRVFAVRGEMGAGKTTLIKAICRALDVTGSTSSPTFNIINEYATTGGIKIYHIDLYRVKNAEEALMAGVEECWTGEDYCFIEWPEIVERYLPDGFVKIDIRIHEGIRHLSIFTP
ncbi:MAG: tRNA (adenosine(37)-N6)-threonylcarbamoyltransferase complex ATPase subunit type 1 TsaE [Chitinophagales bacterium]|nr:tRNA (adenosine(37)-N6)-threonylcarbamoyltransferase complex ATPase subunit type 1 TsaE [Chitinophagales bacterium]MDW8419427.1 tRNA (adenosine(37)-N6)-threonylcarbamoyltransferase complex ATPase subunit type 1 TsaE [Chitinophagales bacterium]